MYTTHLAKIQVGNFLKDLVSAVATPTARKVPLLMHVRAN